LYLSQGKRLDKQKLKERNMNFNYASLSIAAVQLSPPLFIAINKQIQWAQRLPRI